MSRLAALILLAAMSVVSALASAAFDQRVLVGEWAAYDSSWVHGASYTYLRLDERLAGVYAYAYNGGEPILLQFRIADVTASDGFVAITLRRGDDPPFKLVLSAFRAKDDMAGGLATGALYMYRSHGEQLHLFNTIFVRMTPLEGSNVASKPEIERLRQLKLQ